MIRFIHFVKVIQKRIIKWKIYNKIQCCAKLYFTSKDPGFLVIIIYNLCLFFFFFCGPEQYFSGLFFRSFLWIVAAP